MGMYGQGTVWVWTYALDMPLVFVWETRGDLKEGQGRFRGRKEGLRAWDTVGPEVWVSGAQVGASLAREP